MKCQVLRWVAGTCCCAERTENYAIPNNLVIPSVVEGWTKLCNEPKLGYVCISTSLNATGIFSCRPELVEGRTEERVYSELGLVYVSTTLDETGFLFVIPNSIVTLSVVEEWTWHC